LLVWFCLFFWLEGIYISNMYDHPLRRVDQLLRRDSATAHRNSEGEALLRIYRSHRFNKNCQDVLARELVSQQYEKAAI
jgi:hypothetical protein